MSDNVNHPAHYEHYSIEPINVCRTLGFDLGNAIKYILRAPFKNSEAEDYRKAAWYLRDAWLYAEKRPGESEQRMLETLKPQLRRDDARDAIKDITGGDFKEAARRCDWIAQNLEDYASDNFICAPVVRDAVNDNDANWVKLVRSIATAVDIGELSIEAAGALCDALGAIRKIQEDPDRENQVSNYARAMLDIADFLPDGLARDVFMLVADWELDEACAKITARLEEFKKWEAENDRDAS